MDGQPSGPSAFGSAQQGFPSSIPSIGGPSQQQSEAATSTPFTGGAWSGRGNGAFGQNTFGRGTGRGRGGRGSIMRAGAPAGPGRGGKPFGNRSAVFNTSSPATTSADAESDEASASYNDTPSSFAPSNFATGAFGAEPDSTASSSALAMSHDAAPSSSAQGLSVFAAFPSSTTAGSAFSKNSAAPFKSAESTSLRNALGGSKESDDERKRRFENLPKQNRFFEMRAQREALRAKYIREGVLPDPDRPTELAEAKGLVGNCTEMCPEFEREEREFQNEGDALEMFPGTNRIDPRLAVKIYRRPAAGRELPLPEDVRPPEVLRMTLDYLLHDLLPSDPGSEAFTNVQPFMWNRTRAIRQDFIVQGERGALAIECHERIARYHILCLHWRGGVGAEGWSEQQELEQLRKTIRSLTEFYEDMRRKQGIVSPNEAEFRSYNLLLHMQDPETLREAESLPSAVFDSDNVQVALTLRAFAQRSNNVVRRGRPLNTEATMNLWTRFFGQLRRDPRVSYLLACLAENAFSQVRAGALKAMGKTYLSQHAPLPMDYLQRSLGMDSEEEVRTFAVELGAEEEINDQGVLVGVRLHKVNDDKPLPTAPFSRSIVEARRGRFTAQDVVDGRASGAQPLHQSSLPQRTLPPPQIPTTSGARPILPARSGPAHSLPARPQLASVIGSQSASVAPVTSLPPATKPISLSATAPAFTPSALQGSTSAAPATAAPSTSAFGLAATSQAFPQAAPSAPTPTPSAFGAKPAAASFSFGQPATANQAGQASTAFPSGPSITPKPTAATQPVSSFAFSKEPAPVLPQQQQQRPPAPTIQQKVNDTPVAPAPIKALPPPVETVKPPASKSLPASFKKEAAAVVKPVSPPPARPKRTIQSVTDGLYRHLEQEMLDKKVYSIAEQACLREARLRQVKARQQFVDRCAAALTDIVLESAVEQAVATEASTTLAQQQANRTLTETVWLRWRASLRRARERHRQTERLYDVRRQLEARGRKAVPTVSHLEERHDVVERAALMELDDNTLQEKLQEAHAGREDVWKPSTFLWSIMSAFEGLLVPNIDTWTVGLSVPPVQLDGTPAPSSQWLRVKLSLDQQPHAEIAVRSDAHVHMMDLQRCTPDEVAAERSLGLLLFEVDESLSGQWQNDKLWQRQADRLQALTRSDPIKYGRFLPKVMVIFWKGDDSVDAAQQDLWRKTVVKRLHLGATDAVRHAWSQVEIWNAAQAGQAPQRGFDQRLGGLLAPLQWAASRRQVNLEDLVRVYATPWRMVLDRMDASAARLAQVVSTGSQSPSTLPSLARYTFALATALTQRLIEDVLAISELVPDENSNDEVGVLPLPSVTDSIDEAKLPVGSSLDLTYHLAQTQLQQLHQDDQNARRADSATSLVGNWLLEYGKANLQASPSTATFPWSGYFGRLLDLAIDRIQAHWIECTLDTIEDVQRHAHPFVQVCRAAVDELEAKTKAAVLAVAKSVEPMGTEARRNNKRRSQSDESIEVIDLLSDSDEEDQRPSQTKAKRSLERRAGPPQTKTRRLEQVPMEMESTPSPASADPPSRPTSTALSGLRHLIASANELLDAKSA